VASAIIVSGTLISGKRKPMHFFLLNRCRFHTGTHTHSNP